MCNASLASLGNVTCPCLVTFAFPIKVGCFIITFIITSIIIKIINWVFKGFDWMGRLIKDVCDMVMLWRKLSSGSMSLLALPFF